MCGRTPKDLEDFMNILKRHPEIVQAVIDMYSGDSEIKQFGATLKKTFPKKVYIGDSEFLKYGDQDYTEEELEQGFKVYPVIKTKDITFEPIQLLVRCNQFRMIKHLIERGFSATTSINEYGETMLCGCVQTGAVNTFKYLIMAHPELRHIRDNDQGFNIYELLVYLVHETSYDEEVREDRILLSKRQHMLDFVLNKGLYTDEEIKDSKYS